ncbi:MAG TPA: hypothetical protein PKA17_06330, partial [Phenylobacterium sp.]|nr:hypothetical protein [Phenylobacterium sp.]
MFLAPQHEGPADLARAPAEARLGPQAIGGLDAGEACDGDEADQEDPGDHRVGQGLAQGAFAGRVARRDRGRADRGQGLAHEEIDPQGRGQAEEGGGEEGNLEAWGAEGRPRQQTAQGGTH